MTTLARQRCLHHSTREAVARCPECGQYCCRECITEHDDRVICASCLKKMVAVSQKPARRKINPWPALQSMGGFVLALFVFYTVGRMLLTLPEEFHQDSLWRSKWTDFLEDLGND